MNDGQALLRAILDDPDDDAPRLVFADWLEEGGDHARAAHIRAQIKLARLPQDDPDRDRIVQLERTLWKANRDAWKAWVPGWARITRFNRGFVEEIRCWAEDYLARADEVRLRTPLQAVRIDGTREIAVPLFRSRTLEGLRAVHISIPVESGDWMHLSESPYLAHLTTLDLSSNAHPGELVSTLIRSTAFPALRSLRLRWWVLGDEWTPRLVEHPWSARLRNLDLGHNEITSEGARPILDSPYLNEIENLNLKGNPLTADRLTVEALKKRFGDRVRV